MIAKCALSHCDRIDCCNIYSEPLGVILIISAWNVPLALSFLPIVGAIAAGNCAILKMSELAANTAKLMNEIVPKYVDNSAVRLIQGAVPETQLLLDQRFDFIMYTGSGR
jgi:aldehyde dehydrogenase (NAD+)